MKGLGLLFQTTLLLLWILKATNNQEDKPKQTVQQPRLGILLTDILGQNFKDPKFKTLSTQSLINFIRFYGFCDQISQIQIRHTFSDQQKQLDTLKSMISKVEVPLNIKLVYTHIQSIDLKVSKNEKFRVSKESWASHYFMVASNRFVDCETIQTGYKQYLNSPFPSYIKPITGLVGAAFNFKNDDSQFPFTYTEETQYFYAMIKTDNGAFVSKHFLELYFVDIQELKSLRALVDLHQNCEDIMLNVIVGHFYLQLGPKLIIEDIKKKIQLPIAFQTEDKTDPVKDACLTSLADTLGYSPLRNYRRGKEKGLSQWDNPAFPAIVEAKHLLLQELIAGVKQPTKETTANALEILAKNENLQGIQEKLDTIDVEGEGCASRKVIQAIKNGMSKLAVEEMVRTFTELNAKGDQGLQSSNWGWTYDSVLDIILIAEVIILIIAGVLFIKLQKKVSNRSQIPHTEQEQSLRRVTEQTLSHATVVSVD